MELKNKAMLCSLSISMWNARRFDKKVAAEVAKAHRVSEKAGRYNKNLFPEKSESYQAVRAASGNARGEHYRLTLPWSDEGGRILPATNYMAYSEAMRKKDAEFKAAVSTFLAEYPALKREAKEKLNSLYNEADYPAPSEMKYKFAFSTKVLPLPSGKDFRVSLEQEDVKQIREQIDRDMKQAIADAMGDLWQRLFDLVRHFHEQVGDGGIIKEATIKNIHDLCDLIPKLNLTNDPKLIEIQERIRQELGSYDAEDLKKKNKKVRKAAAKTAEKIADDMAAFMGK